MATETTVLVTIEAGAIIVKEFDVGRSTGVVRGDTVSIMGFSVRNKNASGSSSSFINSIELSVRNKNGDLISPNPMISRIAAVRDDDEDHVFEHVPPVHMYLFNSFGGETSFGVYVNHFPSSAYAFEHRQYAQIGFSHPRRTVEIRYRSLLNAPRKRVEGLGKKNLFGVHRK